METRALRDRLSALASYGLVQGILAEASEARVELSLNGEPLPPAMSEGSALRFNFLEVEEGSGEAGSGSGEYGSGSGEVGSGSG